MSEKEREKYLKKEINYYFDVYHSFFLKIRKENKKLVGIVYNNALNMKGQLLKSAIAIRRAVLQTVDTSLIGIYTKMNMYNKMLAKQLSLPIAKRRKDIEQIREKANILEKQLTRLASNLSGFQNLTDLDIKWQNIKKALKDETAIEFIRFDYHNDTKWTDSTLYYALILRKGYKYPKAVFLFEQKELEKVLKQSNTGSDVGTIGQLYKSRGLEPFGLKPKDIEKSKLDSLIWQPFDKYLKGVKTVYISPTGLLHNIAFDAVPYGDSLLLSDRYSIVYTSTTARVAQKNKFGFSDIKNIALFGGIKYSANETELQNENQKYKKESNRAYYSSDKARGIEWTYLKGTKEEIDNIADLFGKKARKIKHTKYSGAQASEEAFKSLELNSHSILHIATHGFYFPEPEDKRKNKTAFNNDKVQYQYSDNALVRSGLLLAGGNHAWSGKKAYKGIEDGVLSAFETSHLNFFKTRLVVLSACQTGLGDVKGSEGVYGLKRAFKMCGVDYIIVSLWSVPDAETQEFMTRFYTNMFKLKDIKKAFDKTQKFMKNKYAGIPYKWAAFVLIN